jgi:hypothetical protein
MLFFLWRISMRQKTLGVFVTLLLLLGRPGRAAVTVSQGEYHGWSGVYRLTNGTVDLIFVPQIGRILRYGYVGERNVLWENAALAGKTTDLSRAGADWQNYGGDKLWPAPQSAWGWPPDPVSDSGAQTVQVLPNKTLLVTGPVSVKYGVRFQREITLNPSGTGVTLRNTMTNVGSDTKEWGIWEVAQADDPEETLFAASDEKRFPGGYKSFGDQKPAAGQVRVEGGLVKIRRRADHNAKIGGRSAGSWIESRWGALRFRVAADLPKAGDYPDGGCGQEIYTSDDPNRYVEMELLAPVQKLDAGASTRINTHWSLSRGR